jgi:curved DNA-binding protein CbpA
LRVAENVDAASIKKAFHELAVHSHPDQYQEGPAEARVAAEAIFKASVEAYAILTNPEHRRRYDALLKTGVLRLDTSKPEEKAPVVQAVTVVSMAQTVEGRKFAAKAQAFIEIKDWEGARIALTEACQREPGNAALQARLKQVYLDRMQK